VFKSSAMNLVGHEARIVKKNLSPAILNSLNNETSCETKTWMGIR